MRRWISASGAGAHGRWRRAARAVLLIGLSLGSSAATGAGIVLVYAYVRPARPDEKTALIAVAVQAVGGLLLLGGLFFTWRTLRISQETLRLNQEGQLTDRFARAVELHGATDDEGGSRLQTRLGAVFALERIGLDSERDRAQVVDVLRAYVLAKAPPRRRPGPDELDAVPRWAGGDVPAFRVAHDIQAILAALTRLVPASAVPASLDLSQVDLRGVRLNGVGLAGIDLTEAWLDDGSLRGARFAGSMLLRAYLTKTDLSEAVLDGARMGGRTCTGSSRGGQASGGRTSAPPPITGPGRPARTDGPRTSTTSTSAAPTSRSPGSTTPASSSPRSGAPGWSAPGSTGCAARGRTSGRRT